jgi:hypothetical protein
VADPIVTKDDLDEAQAYLASCAGVLETGEDVRLATLLARVRAEGADAEAARLCVRLLAERPELAHRLAGALAKEALGPAPTLHGSLARTLGIR